MIMYINRFCKYLTYFRVHYLTKYYQSDNFKYSKFDLNPRDAITI